MCCVCTPCTCCGSVHVCASTRAIFPLYGGRDVHVYANIFHLHIYTSTVLTFPSIDMPHTGTASFCHYFRKAAAETWSLLYLMYNSGTTPTADCLAELLAPGMVHTACLRLSGWTRSSMLCGRSCVSSMITWSPFFPLLYFGPLLCNRQPPGNNTSFKLSPFLSVTDTTMRVWTWLMRMCVVCVGLCIGVLEPHI